MPEISSPPVAQPEPNAPGPAGTGLSPNIAAGLAALFPLVGGIVMLVLEKKDKFVRFWAMQSIFLGGLALAVSVVLQVAGFIFHLLPVVGKLMMLVLWLANLAFSLAWFVAYVVGIVKAFTSKEWEIPWLGQFARKQLAQMDGAGTPPVS